MEYRKGAGNGWFVIAVCAVEGVEDEPFALELACELIGKTPQVSGFKVIHSLMKSRCESGSGRDEGDRSNWGL